MENSQGVAVSLAVLRSNDLTCLNDGRSRRLTLIPGNSNWVVNMTPIASAVAL